MGRLLGGLAAVAGGYSLWHYVFAPMPTVELQNTQVASVTAFMEHNKAYWGQEAWQFADVPAHLARLVEFPKETDKPCFCVMRMNKTFNGVPLLRVVAFFPNTTVAEVAPRFIDTHSRMRWDHNYRVFEEFVTLPTPKAVREMRDGFVVKSRQWCGHKIASDWLQKFGVQPRKFIYERLVAERTDGAVCVTYRSLDGTETETVDEKRVHDAKLSDIGKKAHSAWQALPDRKEKSFSQVLRDTFLTDVGADSQEVQMLWQELLLLPVRRRDLQLHTYERGRKDVAPNHETSPMPTIVAAPAFSVAHEFFKEGSPFASQWQEVLKGPSPAELKAFTGDPKSLEEVGTMMVMTSCNDAKVRPMPRLVEKYASKALTHRTYEWLLDDLAESKLLKRALGSDPRAVTK